MDEKFVRWGVWISGGALALAVLTIVFYLLVPTILNLLMGTSGTNVCEMPNSGTSSLYQGMSVLCQQIKTVFGVSTMLLIVLGGFANLVTIALALFLLLDDKEVSNKIGFIILLVFLGFIGAWLYLRTKKKEAAATPPAPKSDSRHP